MTVTIYYYYCYHYYYHYFNYFITTATITVTTTVLLYYYRVQNAKMYKAYHFGGIELIENGTTIYYTTINTVLYTIYIVVVVVVVVIVMRYSSMDRRRVTFDLLKVLPIKANPTNKRQVLCYT